MYSHRVVDTLLGLPRHNMKLLKRTLPDISLVSLMERYCILYDACADNLEYMALENVMPCDLRQYITDILYEKSGVPAALLRFTGDYTDLDMAMSLPKGTISSFVEKNKLSLVHFEVICEFFNVTGLLKECWKGKLLSSGELVS